MRSITQQLLIGLLGGILASTLIAGASAYFNIYDEANELFDLQLEQLAAALPAQFPAAALQLPQDDPEDEFVIQAWSQDGRSLYTSDAALALPRFSGMGFDTVSALDERWRIYRELRHGRFVQIAQPTSVRQELAADIALESLVPFLFLIPVVAVLIGVVVYRSLKPLRRATLDVSKRSPKALQPLSTDQLPPDVKPIIGALNNLMGELNEALAAQRAFVADAAHELRSPLTALKLQLQLAERAETPQQRMTAFSKLHERLDRSTRLVHQLLTLARQEHDIENAAAGAVNLGQLVQQVVIDYSTVAEDRGIDLGCNVPATPVMVSGQLDDLHILLSNLVDNAIRYTPTGGRVDIDVYQRNGVSSLSVTDTGPGIPKDERARVFDRFYRREGAAETGSGLGLAIVQEIARRHRAVVNLEDPPASCGLAVIVRFGRESGY